MRIFQLLTSRKDSSYQLIISIAVSYILKAICSFLHEYIFITKTFTWSERVIILSVLAIILSVIFVMITEIKFINKILLHINNKSLHDDIWQDILDYRNGTTLRFICGDATYIGVLAGHEEKGNDSWFVLEDYIVESKDENYEAEDMECAARLAINLKNVDRVELYYGESKNSLTDKIKKTKKFKFYRSKAKQK